MRVVGRVAIWIVVGMLLVRGIGAVLSPAGASTPATPVAADDQASSALAVRFARTYLADPGVAQAEVAATRQLGGGEEVLTVACELRDARVLYLAVPISRSRAGEVAVLGAPWMVAAPSTAGVALERPRPIAGSDATTIGALVEKFIPAYVSARSPGDLSYLMAPGAVAVPLAGSLELLGVGTARQLGDGEGPRRTVMVACRLRDPAAGAVYRLAYRLAVIRRNRWYVEGVEGALS